MPIYFNKRAFIQPPWDTWFLCLLSELVRFVSDSLKYFRLHNQFHIVLPKHSTCILLAALQPIVHNKTIENAGVNNVVVQK